MKLCPKCDHSPLPFLMVFIIATLGAFMTWLTLGLSVPDLLPRVAASALTFVAVGATLLHYIFSCLKRHCTHKGGHGDPVTDQRPRVSRQVPAPRQG